MKCRFCGGDQVYMKSPDYGRGAEFNCSTCESRGLPSRFVSDSPEALAESRASKALSRSNAGLPNGPAPGGSNE